MRKYNSPDYGITVVHGVGRTRVAVAGQLDVVSWFVFEVVFVSSSRCAIPSTIALPPHDQLKPVTKEIVIQDPMLGFGLHEAPRVGNIGDNKPERGDFQLLVVLLSFFYAFTLPPQTCRSFEGVLYFFFYAYTLPPQTSHIFAGGVVKSVVRI